MLNMHVSIDSHLKWWYNHIIKKKGGHMMVDKINELKKVVSALIQLALEIGTLLAVIKMVIESIL